MRKALSPRFFAVLLCVTVGLVACDDDDDVTGSRGSLARVSVDAPGSAKTGAQFDVDVSVENVGISNIRGGQVVVTFPSPLRVFSVDSSDGTNATFINDAAGGGARVFWDLGTLDSNSQSRLTAQTAGFLASGQNATRVTIQASLSGQDIRAGDAVAGDDVTIEP